MLISTNTKPSLREFHQLMMRVDNYLNADARRRPNYYKTRGGSPLEDDVLGALKACSSNTAFENTIVKISGHKFPDIVAAKYYGVEVKSTKDDHWTSTGSSILETTRVSDVERIFMTFGKLGGDPIEFLSRPYEECLSGIAVTHMPRYLIDMRLGEGETIFDKMGISYDDLRTRDNPIAPVSKYYRSQLKKGESLWWAADQVEEPVSATVKLWSALSKDEKDRMVVRGMVYFPELFGPTSPTKYNRYCLWLITQGIVNPNVRDGFSAGGQVPIRTYSGGIVKMPAVYGRILKYAEYIRDIINDTDCKVLEEYWNDDIEENRLSQWAKMASSMATNDLKVGYNKADKVFESIFPELRRKNMYEAKHRFSKVAESSTEYGAKSKSNNYEAEVVTLRKGQKVRHKAYGMCMITAIEDDRIWVKHNNDFETGVNDYTYEEFGEMFEIIN